MMYCIVLLLIRLDPTLVCALPACRQVQGQAKPGSSAETELWVQAPAQQSQELNGMYNNVREGNQQPGQVNICVHVCIYMTP